MTHETDQAAPMAFPFPDGPEDGDTYFHKNLVFYYHESINTWEVATVDGND